MSKHWRMHSKKGESRGGGESELEKLKGKNRELTKQIRELKKYIEVLERKLAEFERGYTKPNKCVKTDTSESTIKNVEAEETKCPECGKGVMQQFNFSRPGKTYKFLRCNVCGYRMSK